VALLKAMIGAKHFIDHGNALSFQFPNKQRSKGNYLKVTLRPDDTYDMEFSAISGGGTKVKKVKTYSGIMFDQLQPLFTEWTGLYAPVRSAMIFTEEERSGLRALAEKRFKDVRQHQKKAASGAQVSKKFKMAQQALGDLESALRPMSPDLAREIDHITGLVRGVEKRL